MSHIYGNKMGAGAAWTLHPRHGLLRSYMAVQTSGLVVDVLNGVPLRGLLIQPPDDASSKRFAYAATLASQGPSNINSLMDAALTWEIPS